MRNARWILALTLTAGFVIAGCGSDDSSTSNDAGSDSSSLGDGGEPLTKPDYITQADAICGAGDKELSAELGKIEGGATADNADEGAAVFIENLRGQTDDLRQLNPPAGDEAALAEIYDLVEESTNQLEDDSGLILTEDGPPALADASTKAKAYGFSECGS